MHFGYNRIRLQDVEKLAPLGVRELSNTISSFTSDNTYLAKVKNHIRVTHTDDDDNIRSLIQVAIQSLQISTGRIFCIHNFRAFYRDFPSTIRKLKVPNPPFLALSSLKYYNQHEQLVTFDSNQLVIEENGSGCSNIGLKDGTSRPSVSSIRETPVQIEYSCGYGGLGGLTLPEPLNQAIFLLVAHYYDTREPVSFGANPMVVPKTVDFLIDQYKVKKI